MSRYTAIRTTLITSAVLKPLFVMAGFVCIALRMDTTYLLVFMAGFLFVSILPGLCVDPVVEEETAKPHPSDGIFGYIQPLCVSFSLMWIFDQPEVRTFFSALATRLWDWRPMAVVMILCIHRLRKDLRFALGFKLSHLYPHLKSMEKREAP